MISFAKFHPNFQRVLLKIWKFLLRFRIRNLYKMFAQNARNRISKVLDFKIFRGGKPPDPPTGAELLGIPHAKPWIRPLADSHFDRLCSQPTVNLPNGICL